MKFVPLRTGAFFSSIKTMRELVSVSAKGFGKDEMKKRLRVLKVLDKAQADNATHLLLEDADHETLKGCFDVDSFSIANPELMAIIDDIDEAKEPPAIVDQQKPTDPAA